ncbi:MAG: FAD-binding oxidoreductase [Pseudomonadota bacterium]
MSRTETLIERIGDIPVLTQEKLVQAKSRDFYWYSPVLKRKLDRVCADVVVSPRSEDEVREVLAHCWALDLPVTPRGGGTGNYGQAMPLAGGVVLDMTRMKALKGINDGVARVEPGALMGELQQQTRNEAGLELRMHPSTLETATIGGFLAGGSGGVGSINWGMLRETGNILSLRVATAEQEPRLLQIEGDAIQTVLHAYGTNGIITEIEMPLSPAQDWIEVIASFDDWMAAVRTGWSLAHQEGLWFKQLAAIQAPAPFDYFARHRKFLEEGDNLLCILAAPSAIRPLIQALDQAGGRLAYRSDTAAAEEKKGLPHLHHLTWNHTTFRALKTDPEMTYLQVGLPASDPIGMVERLASEYPGEIIGHVEITRSSGRVSASFLPIYRFSSEARLIQVAHELEAAGCACYNPHAYTYEEGNHSGPDEMRLAMKRRTDPKGLLNPGKMIGWDDPDYVYDTAGGYDYPGLKERAA